MNFEREIVPGITAAAPSLLFATLNAQEHSTPAASGLRERRRGGSGGGRDSPTHTTRHVTGYAVAEVRALH